MDRISLIVGSIGCPIGCPESNGHRAGFGIIETLTRLPDETEEDFEERASRRAVEIDAERRCS